MHRYVLELVTVDDVKEFTEAVSGVKSDVRLTGKDENGNKWELSGKSLLCSLSVSPNSGLLQLHFLFRQQLSLLWNPLPPDL